MAREPGDRYEPFPGLTKHPAAGCGRGWAAAPASAAGVALAAGGGRRDPADPGAGRRSPATTARTSARAGGLCSATARGRGNASQCPRTATTYRDGADVHATEQRRCTWVAATQKTQLLARTLGRLFAAAGGPAPARRVECAARCPYRGRSRAWRAPAGALRLHRGQLRGRPTLTARRPALRRDRATVAAWRLSSAYAGGPGARSWVASARVACNPRNPITVVWVWTGQPEGRAAGTTQAMKMSLELELVLDTATAEGHRGRPSTSSAATASCTLAG